MNNHTQLFTSGTLLSRCRDEYKSILNVFILILFAVLNVPEIKAQNTYTNGSANYLVSGTGFNNIYSFKNENPWKTVHKGQVKIDGSKVQYSLEAMPSMANPSYDLDQARNGGPTSPINPPNWVNGNANSTQAHYVEGWSIPYRIVLSNLDPGSHTVRIQWDITASGSSNNAIDYITHYQNLDNPPGSHLAVFGHQFETVDPTIGVTGLGAPSTFPIPPPSSAGSPVPGQPTTSFNALGVNELGQNLKLFTIYNGTITSLSYSAQGSLTGANSATTLNVVFTTTNSTVVLAWGGHIASQLDWGFGNSAAAINGSNYHTRVLDLDGTGGNQDRALQTSAVFVLPECNVTGPTTACPGQSLCFSGSINEATINTGYTWSIINNTAGASIFSGAASGTVQQPGLVVPGICVKATQGGSYTVKLTVTRLSPAGILVSHDCFSQVVTVTPLSITGDIIASEADDDVDGIKPLTGTLDCPKLYEMNLLKTNVAHLTASGAAGTTYTWAFSPNTGANVSFLDNGDGTATFTINSTLALASEYKFIVTGTNANGCVAKDSLCIRPTSVLPLCNLCGPAIICDGAGDKVYSLKDNCANANPDALDLDDFNYVWSITNVAGGGNVTFVGANVDVATVTTHITGTVTGYTVQLNINGKGPLHINVPPCTINTIVTNISASAVATNALCFGGNGSVNLAVTGGTAPFTYLWSNGATTEDLASVPSGSYNVTVTDANGCTATANATVTAPPDLTASAIATNALCFGSNGSVNLTVGGGTAPYTFLWSNGATTEDLASVPAAAYSVTVTDANGCTETANATVIAPPDLTASAIATDAACNESNGSVDLTVGGGTAPYTFLWSNGATTEDLASVPAGPYSVTVTDANGCTESANATVNAPSDITAGAIASNALCFGGNGSVALTVSGGTAPYTFLWSNGATTEDLASVPAGFYSVIVTDANGCTETANATVNEPSEITASALATDALCFGGNGSVDLTVSGGTAPYTFLWSNGATTEDLVSVPAGSYSVTVTDANGCIETANATANEPADITASAIATDALCFGGNGSVDLTVNGGTAPYTFLWSNGATTEDLASVPAGSYSVTVTDANGCTETANATVNEPSDLTASAIATDAACNGNNGSVDLTVSGGTAPYTFLWSNGATSEDLASVPAGSYSVIVTDANGCTETANATVNSPSDITAGAIATDALCFGGNGSVDLTVSGGTAPYTFLWSNGATTEDLASVPAGSYSVTVTDANGCTETANATVNEPSDITANAIATNGLCFGGNGSVDLTVSGGTAPYTFLWSNGATTEDLAVVPAGSYSVTVTDANGCTETANATVNEPVEITAYAIATNALCFDGNGAVDLFVSGGTGPYTFLWSNGATTQNLASVLIGALNLTLSVTVTDANGCAKLVFVLLNAPPRLSCSLLSPATVANCSTTGNIVSGSVSGGTGPFTCSASFDATGTGAGWSVTNCAVSAGGVISVTYNAGTTASTVLTVIVTDANGCQSTCTVTLTCTGGKACTPGFWKTHPEVWDSPTDFVVSNMPGDLTNPVTPGGTFTTSTSFWAYFDIPQGSCNLPNEPLTMLEATATGGGDCIALARHAVSALLGAAAFPGEYPFPAGSNSFAGLYTMIRDAFINCSCEPLHTTLANINELDGPFCGALSKLPKNGSAPVTANSLKVADLFVKAYPNPYNGAINFNVVSPVSGKANLEIFDYVGRRLAIVYSGSVTAGVPMTVRYNVPSYSRVPMIYKLSVGKLSVHGKLSPGDGNIDYKP